ncbi:MAG TPA: protein-disulfide reductase DsbD [Oxalicibacterium sp.]|nr:protein-disulfide reductase DsbD [Oxalicibacterium sp.]
MIRNSASKRQTAQIIAVDQAAAGWRKICRVIAGCIACVLLALASPALVHASDDYLAPEAAFRFSASMADAQTIVVRYQVADGYYLYRERFAFKAEGARLGQPEIPPGVVKFDETFQKNVETYHGAVSIRIPVQASTPFTLIATSQGCADKGLCYPPMESRIRLDPALHADSSQRTEPATMPASELGGIQSSLQSGKLLTIIPLFVLLGVGLAFTPCVLPMLPILSGIIVGEGAATDRRRSFVLALVYALGMALVYTALGVAAGLAGQGLSAALQNPWVLGAFGLLMVGLALSMFDVYQLQMPAALQTRLAQASGRHKSGKLFGVFMMGAISALIVGPCVAAPLAGALVYISQTRDVLVGGSALFALAVGMSVPLLLIGVSAGALLPRAGAWMNGIKRLFGVLMLAVALWMVGPVIPAAVLMLGWALLGIGYGAYLLWAEQGRWLPKAFGIALLVLGALELAGLAMGHRDPLAPLASKRATASAELGFQRVKTVAELDAILAQSGGKPLMLDFYADWCVSCIEMEKYTFSDPQVRAQLAGMILLQADVTKNDADDKAMLQRFNLFGPPGIIFFDGSGREIAGGRVIGFQNAAKFTQSLMQVRQSQNGGA